MGAIKRITFYILILVFLSSSYLAWKVAPNYNGYCKSSRDYLTDDEKMNIAVESVLASYPPSIKYNELSENNEYNIGWRVPIKPVFYSSIEEFYEINLNCCEVTLKNEDFTYVELLFARVVGNLSSFVHVRYKVKYFNDNDVLVSKYSDKTLAITNCGRAWSPY